MFAELWDAGMRPGTRVGLVASTPFPTLSRNISHTVSASNKSV